MPSGLRVTRIDHAPRAGLLEVGVNGLAMGGLPHHGTLELTVASGELLLELLGRGSVPVFQVLDIAPGCTADVRVGRRRTLGLGHPSHYLHVERPLLGLPDRTLHPLNLSAQSALGWLQEKRALGEPMSAAQRTYLQTRLGPPLAGPPQRASAPAIPSLAQLGAFAALGLDSDAREAEVREAYRLLKGIHSATGGGASETLQRLEEAFHVAMDTLGQRVRSGAAEAGR
ncbi:MAG: hypothetical protein VKP70_06285 [Cyanobacteriota bacterium]|nr:hypothetical protein [Cyanobacteriota bacterium]